MEEYKKYLKKKRNFYEFLVVITIILGFLNSLSYINLKPIGTQEFGSFICGIESGMNIFVLFLSIYYDYRNFSILNDEVKLKNSYIKYMDERTKAIREKAGGEVLQICGIIVFVVGVIFAYINQIASLTLIGCSLFLLLTRKSLILYYSKKY